MENNQRKELFYSRAISTPKKVSRKDINNLIGKLQRLNYDVDYEYNSSYSNYKYRYKLTNMNESTDYSERMSVKELYLVLLTVYNMEIMKVKK